MAGMRETMKRFCTGVAMLLVAIPALAQVERVVTTKLERYSIAALVMHLENVQAFKHGIALFPGHPGIMKLREENGQPQYEMRGNFLVRSRRHWLDEDAGRGGRCAVRRMGHLYPALSHYASLRFGRCEAP
jgi:hypothetical protein